MARILGLDLGSYSVKGMLTEVTLRGAQIRGFGEVRRGEKQLTEALRALLDQLFPPQALHRDQVVTSLPGQSLVTHLLTLPFTESKQIEAALPFEVEGQLPSSPRRRSASPPTRSADSRSSTLVMSARRSRLGAKPPMSNMCARSRAAERL